TKLARFSSASGSAFRCPTVLKKSVCSTAPASRASLISLGPSSRTFPSGAVHDGAAPQPPRPTRAQLPPAAAMPAPHPSLLSPGAAFSYHSPGPAELRSTAGGGGGGGDGSRGLFCAAASALRSFWDGSTRTGLRRSARTPRRPAAATATAASLPVAAAGGKRGTRVLGAEPPSARPLRCCGTRSSRRAARPPATGEYRPNALLPWNTNVCCSQCSFLILMTIKCGCSSPYDGKWSKTMVGYGPEDNHFVAELTYNYGIGEYRLGNDFLGITLVSSQAVSNAKKMGWPLKQVTTDVFEAEAPGGYKFYLEDKKQLKQDPVLKVTLGVSDLQKSVNYWSDLLGMKIYEKDESKQRALLGYADNQCKLELKAVDGAVDHGTAFGRIAFSCAKEELPKIEALMKKENQKILTPLVSLDTPGKATVQVIILADPDGHEICFVGDEAFRDLSKVDPNGDKLLDDAMAADDSDKWFAEKKMKKASA
ncbi:GLOD4 protein, partial [Halcyon senegalensis]|nr:GLOD4 protein [Halcyon senegalensis]